MAAIVALVVPARRASELESLAARAARMLADGPHAAVACEVVHGRDASVALCRVGPDAINRAPQPAQRGPRRGVLCGYFFGPGFDAAAADARAAHAGLPALLDTLADGPSALARADGVYAFASWDAEAERLVAGVDKLGMRPLYHAALPGGGHAVASEIKAIVPLLDALAVSAAAWEEQLSFGYQLGTHTLLEGIARFGPAEVLTCAGGRVAMTTVEHFLEDIEPSGRSREEFLEENHELFQRSMARGAALLPPDRPPILTLSGGLDSRRILASMLATGQRPDVFTVPLIRQDQTEVDTKLVRALAAAAELPATRIFPPTAADAEFVRATRDLVADFETDEHHFYTTIAAALARPDQVNFDGLAGDTLINPARFLSSDALASGGDEQLLRRLGTLPRWASLPATDPPLAERVRVQWAHYGPLRNRFSIWALHQRGRRELALGPMLIQARAFESVFPYLDRAFIRSALALDPAQRVGTLMQRPLIAAFGIQPLSDLPSTRDQDFATDMRWVSADPRPDAPGHAFTVRAARRRHAPAGWGPRPRAAAALWAGGVLARWSPRALAGPRFRPVVDVARGVNRLAGHLEASASPAAYVERLGALRGLWGSRADWLAPL